MASDIQQFFRDHGISEVEAIIPDMAGIARGKVMPAAKFAEDEGMRLPESIFLQTVTGDYPEDPEGAMNPAEIDIVLRADPKTVRRVPWAAEPTAQVIHDCFYADGRRVTMAPRHVLRQVLELYAQRGWDPVVAPELAEHLDDERPRVARALDRRRDVAPQPGGAARGGGRGVVGRGMGPCAATAGVTLRNKAAVTRMLVEGDRACGVALAGGEERRADLVVSAANPRITFQKLVGARHLDNGFLKRTYSFRSRGAAARRRRSRCRCRRGRSSAARSSILSLIHISEPTRTY